MAILDFAIEHARAGRPVFPGIPDEKRPAIGNPYAFATTDERAILRWWKENPKYNICIPAGIEVEPGKFLGVIDIDTKNANGFATVDALAFMGYEFPETLTQLTPSKGEHWLYYFTGPISNGAGKTFGKGIDHRGFHGYIVGAGSWYHGQEYLYKNKSPIQAAPEWIATRCLRQGSARERSVPDVHVFNSQISERRALEYLKALPPAREGERNRQGFEAGCRLKDFGIEQERTEDILTANWKCEPPLEREELTHVVASAFKYGQNPVGVDAPEAAFEKVKLEVVPKVKTPLEEMNERFSFIMLGGQSRILYHTQDEESARETKQCSVHAFHDLLANESYQGDGGKSIPMSKAWMQWKGRRSYDGFTFMPEGCKNSKYFNLWQGFSCEPLEVPPTPKAQRALDLFKEHILVNVAEGNAEHANWIFGWMAHMFQRPHEKPRTALVLRGDKGVGKSIIFKSLAKIARKYSVSVANRRYLSGNFNAHLENTLLYCLEEAFWSGAKDTEGILKDIVTSDQLFIERKGLESYTAKNLLRVLIMGNEDWIVPASERERRYAVFEVGDRNRKDAKFFGPIADDMDPRLLLKFFMDFDLSTVDVNTAPDTMALGRQKVESLPAFKAWWYESLRSGEILGSHSETWPDRISCQDLRQSFLNETKALGGRHYLPGLVAIGRDLKRMAPSVLKRQDGGESRKRHYVLPSLAQARADWEKYLHQPIDWGDD